MNLSEFNASQFRSYRCVQWPAAGLGYTQSIDKTPLPQHHFRFAAATLEYDHNGIGPLRTIRRVTVRRRERHIGIGRIYNRNPNVI